LANMTLLRAENISKAFPGVQALDNISFEAIEGEVHGLVGENGAGKTTLAHILSGSYVRDEGHIWLNGKEVKLSTPHEAAQLGISIVHQEAALAPSLSVADNIFLGHMPTSKMGLVGQRQMNEAAAQILRSIGQEINVQRRVDSLTVAEQQIVEIAKTLALNSKIIFMDEPTSSLSAKEIDRLFELINRLKSERIAIVFVSHRLDEIFRICDRITVLRDGKLIATVMTDETSIDEVIRMMVGRSVRVPPRTDRQVTTRAILEVKGLQRGNEVKKINFCLHEGEVLGFAGLVGAGRSKMAATLFGLTPAEAGEIYVEGRRVPVTSPRDAVAAGMGFVPEDRKQQGLFLNMAVRENISISILYRLVRAGMVNRTGEMQIVKNFIQRLNIRTPSLEQAVTKLSGGNQQKVVIARWLAVHPKVLILDEPTQGIDVGAKAEIYNIINDLATQGIGIIFISSDLPELLAISDRILVMRDGSIVSEHAWTEALSEEIMSDALRQSNGSPLNSP
jgi:ribose transport system ATP-binding protein